MSRDQWDDLDEVWEDLNRRRVTCGDCDKWFPRDGDWTRCPTCGEVVCADCLEYDHFHCRMCGERKDTKDGACLECEKAKREEQNEE